MTRPGYKRGKSKRAAGIAARFKQEAVEGLYDSVAGEHIEHTFRRFVAGQINEAKGLNAPPYQPRSTTYTGGRYGRLR